MTNTKIIKKRIRTAKNIAQITKAMEMVAASKMRRSQTQALLCRPYSEMLESVLLSLMESETKIDHPLTKINESKVTAIFLVTTDKGLCGGLNTNQFRFLKYFLNDYPNKNIQFLVIGKKGQDFLIKSHFEILASFPQLKENFIFEDTLDISHFLINAYLNNKIGQTFISFTKFISTLSQKPKIVQLLPINPAELSKDLGIFALKQSEEKTQEKIGRKEYLIEPDPKIISQQLLPYFIELAIYYYLLEAKASEHSARMIAMKNASDNALEIIKELNLTYNKARQMQITNQLADLATATLAIKN